MIMPPFQSIPRICIDSLDGSPRSLSSSSTLDTRDIMTQVKLWPDLLAEDFLFDDVDDALCLDDDRLQDIPSFPIGHRPPLFILQAHRMRLPFPIRQEAFELGDISLDEETACPLLTAPTIPRMKMMIKEQLYVQKWVDSLTSDGPPKHIPWSCDKPATERKWIAEGSIFPSDMVKISSEQCVANPQASSVPRTNRRLALAECVPRSSKPCAFSTIRSLSESVASGPRVSVKSAEIDSRMLRGESRMSGAPKSITKVSGTPPPPTLPHPGFASGTAVAHSDVPLAARRGKSLGGLILKGNVIEQLEYPDIPTAFRGFPTVWSPQVDAFSIPSFTDHQSMLLDLKLKGAALGSGVSVCDLGNSRSYPEITHTALDVDECAFTEGPASFDNISGPVGDEFKEIAASPSIPGDASTLARGLSFSACTRFVSLPRSSPAFQSPAKRSSDPPGAPLPPRPALVNPSTPPHVRGILKKAKSVRFEDVITKESHDTLPIITHRVSSERPSPKRAAVTIRRPCTPMPMTTKSRGQVKELPMLGREDTTLASRPRLSPRRTRANRKLELMRNNDNDPLETSKSVTVTLVERPCRTAHVKRNVSPPAIFRAQARQKGLSITEANVRRGIEGNTKSRLSTPLRNIFRFR